MADQKKYINKLVDSRILIIGGSSGIGYAVAEACLEYGAIVHISSSNPSRIDTAISKLLSAYPSAKERIRGTPVDLSSSSTLESEIENLFKTVVKDMPDNQLDHVIFTAADPLSIMPLKDLSMDKILKAGQIRFFAPLMIAKFLPTYLPNTPTSSFTITTGGISEKPIPGWSVIGSYAGGHHAMVRNLALDLKPIRVCGVSPGVVDTELWTMEGEQRKAFLEACGKKMATGVPGEAAEVAESFLAILKDRNMDGSVIRTDGGHMLM
jgi:NAD(P)-dependent dehydrogenase (short-subunit alcohol dehydrogenase family)